ncbi:response regulator transcription factor [Streptomyces cinnamoneus]|uniref:response regulator transcription factor n=1 Tax=Streptomyces cinnamoneus TaxID=53446 RepID=UPI003424E520
MSSVSVDEASPDGLCRASGRERTVRILLAADKDVFRNGLCVLLSQIPGAEVVGAAADRDDLLRKSALHVPDVLVASASLLTAHDFEAVCLLAGGIVGGIVMVAEDDTDELLREALAAGVRGYLPLDSPQSDFHAAVRAVVDGGAFLPTHITRRLFGNFHLVPRRSDEPAELRTLSRRERQVLLLIGGGRNNREIARNLSLSEATVKSHVSRILAKLNLRDRVHVAQLVWRLGLDVQGAAQQP